MVVSVFADASWSNHYKKGGWGCWVKSGRGTAKAHGAFKVELRTSNDAELCAALNAIVWALKRGIAMDGDLVLVQSDCMRVVQLMSGMQSRLSPAEKSAMKLLAELKKTRSLTIRARHVPGHTAGDQPRLWVNNLCDELARKGFDKARK